MFTNNKLNDVYNAPYIQTGVTHILFNMIIRILFPYEQDGVVVLLQSLFE